MIKQVKSTITAGHNKLTTLFLEKFKIKFKIALVKTKKCYNSYNEDLGKLVVFY